MEWVVLQLLLEMFQFQILSLIYLVDGLFIYLFIYLFIDHPVMHVTPTRQIYYTYYTFHQTLIYKPYNRNENKHYNTLH
jgi:hypothetical protein